MARINLTLRSRLLLSFIAVAACIGILSVLSGIHLIGATQEHATRVFFILIFAALIAAAGISYAVLHSIMKPVTALTAAIEEIADGPTLREINIGHAPPEIEALVSAFNRMQEAIRERRRLNQEKLLHSDRLAMVGQLAAGVAHEINNPLGSILLFTRLIMQQSPENGRVHENLERIEKETKRCHSIIQSLLDFARQREPNVEPVDVNQLLEATIKFFERQYLFKNIEVVRHFSAGLSRIQADQLQLQQVFMNIILNALDAMNGKGLLTLETVDAGGNGSVEIRISDTGCGIPPENMDRIFDPFFTTKDVGRGTGLGLSVSYGIIQTHNGDISVSSAPGEGSQFTITLPKMKGSA
jgi:two-component system NtrC family sensor kinase